VSPPPAGLNLLPDSSSGTYACPKTSLNTTQCRNRLEDVASIKTLVAEVEMETESDLPPLYNSDGEPDWDAAELIAYKKINFGNRIKRINNTTSNESPDEDDGEPQPKKKAGKNRKSKKSNKPKKDSLLEKKKKSKSEEPKSSPGKEVEKLEQRQF
ncbi:hypothetical protein FS842_001381, partial [Serendipita sp. 407]